MEKNTNNTERKRRRGLDGTALKWIAVLTMLIDHTTVCFLERVQGPDGWMLASSSDTYYMLDRVGRAIGRQAFPIFAFFIVEGFFHTRSRWRYLGRLAAFSAVSELPFWLLNYTGPIGERLTRSVNVYATLALGLAAIWIVEAVYFHRDGGYPRILLCIAAVGGICLLAFRLNTDYDYIGIIAILILYIFRRAGRGNRTGSLIGCLGAWVWMGSNNEYEWFALPAFLLCALCYNGKRGGSVRHRTAEKYFFYAFYPVHLLILWGIRRALFGY